MGPFHEAVLVNSFTLSTLVTHPDEQEGWPPAGRWKIGETPAPRSRA